MPVDPSFAVQGAEWAIGPLQGPQQAGPANQDFGQMLAGELQSLQNLQGDASTASRKLAEGSATDPTEALMAVERARLGMQLASTVRTKGVEAVQDIFRTQV